MYMIICFDGTGNGIQDGWVAASSTHLLVLIIIEACQAKSNGLEYFKSAKNYVDFGIILSHIIFLIFHFKDDQFQNVVFTVVVFLAIWRGMITLF